MALVATVAEVALVATVAEVAVVAAVAEVALVATVAEVVVVAAVTKVALVATVAEVAVVAGRGGPGCHANCILQCWGNMANSPTCPNQLAPARHFLSSAKGINMKALGDQRSTRKSTFTLMICTC